MRNVRGMVIKMDEMTLFMIELEALAVGIVLSLKMIEELEEFELKLLMTDDEQLDCVIDQYIVERQVELQNG